MSGVLHGTFLPDRQRFVWWAEASGEVPPKRRRTLLDRGPARHPFALPETGLISLLQHLAPHAKPQRHEGALWLPTSANAPHPSPELLEQGAPPPAGEDVTLAAWRVGGLSVTPLEAVDMLLALDGRQTVGADVSFWRRAALLALSLVAAQEIVPALERDGFILRALWRIQAEHPEHITALAAAMPPQCRAWAADPDNAPSPALLLNQFLAMVVDAAARDAAQTAKLKLPAPTTPGGKWLTALTGSNPEVALKGAEADALFTAWKTWAGQSDVAGNAAFRIAFRLDAPESEEGTWGLAYLLQATDDPSLIVPAREVWRGQMAGYLTQRFEGPQERLLAGLGFAARLFPPIEASLRRAAPETAHFTATEAGAFLKEAAPVLKRSGFHVLLPRWWGGKTSHVTARAKLKSGPAPNKATLSLSRLVSYEWEVMLGGASISAEEFERLAALKQPLVRWRGQWIVLDEAQIAAGLKYFARGSDKMTLGEAVRVGLSGELSDGESVEKITATGWLKALIDKLGDRGRIEARPLPAGLEATLRPYQHRGYEWLAFLRAHSLSACLADDMGLGKTLQAITFLLHERESLKVSAPALVVCPTSVVGNWRRELHRFAPGLRALVHQGAGRASKADLKAQAEAHDVVITSYPLLARDRAGLEAIAWSSVILDEAQNIKNAATKQAQAARALNTDYRLALTGTPVENRLSELWSIFHFLNPGYLGSEQHFRKHFGGPIERLNDKTAAERLRKLTGPFILRRVKTDPTIIDDLPEKQEMKVYCNLTTEQGTLYQAVVKDAMSRIEEAEASGDTMSRRGLVLSMLMRLKQICNHPAQFLKEAAPLEDRSGKLARLTEMLEEVYAAGDRALVFTQFAEMGTLIQQHLQATFVDVPLWLHGGTPVREREAMIQRFSAPKGPTVFILSLKAGGTGLNLTRANHVFHFDRWWNPAVEDQATDRAFRIGQTRNVQVHKFVCAGTLEEQIDEMIERKKALAQSVVGSDESWLTELSTSALRDLVTLRTSEVS